MLINFTSNETFPALVPLFSYTNWNRRLVHWVLVQGWRQPTKIRLFLANHLYILQGCQIKGFFSTNREYFFLWSIFWRYFFE